jgi:two-component system cell cycle sensor histidine kinase/response regulator CckA
MDKMLRRLIDENIEMTIVPGKQIGRIKADSGYVGQVLMNLVVNARDAMPNGGKLTIATSNVTLDENYARAHRRDSRRLRDAQRQRHGNRHDRGSQSAFV